MTRAAARALALTAGASVALGVVVGVLWFVTAPRVDGDLVGGVVTPRVLYSEGSAIANLELGVFAFVAGIVVCACGLKCARTPIERDGMFLGALLGGIAGAATAARIGAAASAGWETEVPLSLDMPGVLLLWPLGAALVALASGLVVRRRYRRGAAADAGDQVGGGELDECARFSGREEHGS